jgi:hypothetical protein
VDFGDQIRLHRLTQSADTIESGDRLLLQMDWQALDLPAADYSLFVHLLDQDNRLVAQRDVPLLDHGLTTRAWTAEQVATLWVELTIPPGTPPGRYRMALGLYNSNDGQRLISGAADFVDLGSVIIDPLRDPAFETLWILRFQPGVAYSEITLTGFDRYKSGFSHAPGTPLRPGDLLRLELTWQAHVQPTQDWMLEARLVDQNNGVVASVSGDLVGEHYPSSQWKGGETVRGHYDLVLPANLAPGRLQLQLRAYPRGARQVGSWVELGPVVVQ